MPLPSDSFFLKVCPSSMGITWKLVEMGFSPTLELLSWDMHFNKISTCFLGTLNLGSFGFTLYTHLLD